MKRQKFIHKKNANNVERMLSENFITKIVTQYLRDNNMNIENILKAEIKKIIQDEAKIAARDQKSFYSNQFAFSESNSSFDGGFENHSSSTFAKDFSYSTNQLLENILYKTFQAVLRNMS